MKLRVICILSVVSLLLSCQNNSEIKMSLIPSEIIIDVNLHNVKVCM